MEAATPEAPDGGLARSIAAGLRSRCPNCAQGPLFEGFLAVRPRCGVCGFDLTRADSGDGPAVFVILVAGAIVGFMALLVAIAFRPPIWVHLILWMPLTVVVCLGLLRPFKGVLVALQFHHGAGGGHV